MVISLWTVQKAEANAQVLHKHGQLSEGHLIYHRKSEEMNSTENVIRTDGVSAWTLTCVSNKKGKCKYEVSVPGKEYIKDEHNMHGYYLTYTNDIGDAGLHSAIPKKSTELLEIS